MVQRASSTRLSSSRRAKMQDDRNATRLEQNVADDVQIDKGPMLTPGKLIRSCRQDKVPRM